MTAKHREALAALLFGITQRKGLLVITGGAGTGKTTLIRKLLVALPATSAQFSVVINPALTRSELLEYVLMDFGMKEVPSSKARRLSMFSDLLNEASRSGRFTVLIVDEAHLLGAELIEEIRLLSNFETTEQKLLQIVLAGQTELNNVLNLESMTQVKQRIAIRMHLDPLSQKEVDRYLQTRWERGGAREPLPFGTDAIEVITRFSGGVPRVINSICDAALVNAYGTGVKEIASKDILEVIADLQLASADQSGATASPLPNVRSPAKAPGSMLPNLTTFTTLNKYMPGEPKARKRSRLANWFRFARAGVE
ncbi:MAG TPA: AAA family ATPase [Bryobacteraceae bacterium]|nr:AAA family ATPase [Bryobacteraceae bacterium]